MARHRVISDMSSHSISWPFRPRSFPGVETRVPLLDYYGAGADFFDFRPLEDGTLTLYLCATDRTLFYARVDPVRRELRYVNDGQEPALLVHRNALPVQHLGGVGAGERRVALEPGDVLAAYSGGVTEQAALDVIREDPDARAGVIVSRILEGAVGTAVAVRVIAAEEPAIAEESDELELAVA